MALFSSSLTPWLALAVGLLGLTEAPAPAPPAAEDVRRTPDTREVERRSGTPKADVPPREVADARVPLHPAELKPLAIGPDSLEAVVIQVGNDSLARLRHLRAPWRDRQDLGSPSTTSPLYLRNPSNVQRVVELSPDGKGYYIYERVGGRDVRPPTYITKEEYERQQRLQQQADYFRRKSASSAQSGTAARLVPTLNVNSALFRDVFGSGKIDIRPNVTALLDLSARTNEQQNPSLNLRQQANTFFDFRQQIQMNVVGTIGERLRLRASYDTEASFNFENQFKVEYAGQEDDIVKRIEAGNVSLPLNSSLITGGQNLWGIKAAFQLGPVMVTAVASQQRGRTNEIVVRNGAQQSEYTKQAHEYDENRHFFLNHFFRSRYERSLQRLPLVQSPIKVTRIEVYVTNRSNAATQNNRNGVGLVDLAENDTTRGGRFYDVQRAGYRPGTFPDNEANGLYGQLASDPAARTRQGVQRALTDGTPYLGDTLPHFELVENMRRLNETEFVLNAELGYISLNQRLQPNDVLFVAYEYTLIERPGVPFKVGEFSNDVPADQTNNNVLFLKMLKPSANRPVAQRPNSPDTVRVNYPAWDLMMKNVYAISAFNLQREGFRLDIVYRSPDGSGDINYLPSSSNQALAQRPLIQTLRLDQLSNNNDPGADNRFDFIPGVTVVPDRGYIVFPVVEPFGRTITDQLPSPREDSLFGYPQLYRLTQMDALQLHPSQNRFFLKGLFQNSSSQEVQLNAVQIVPGSVRVTANGAPLMEGTDYTVDYQVGKVLLLNSGLRSTGAEVRINFESNTLFGIDQKTLLGTRIDYKVARNLLVGGTLMYLNERPLINKIVIGEEPMANLLWGLDVNWSTQSQLITRGLDRLPFYSTTTPSDLAVRAEFAQLQPGFPSQISTDRERGISYIDDFEGTATFLDLGNQAQNWVLASRPQRSPVLLGANNGIIAGDTLSAGYRRARLSWYQIDARFFDRPQDFGLNNQSPALNNPYSRRVSIPELFPNRTIAGTDFLQTFDLQYTPDERGPYNYASSNTLLNPNGTLRDPQLNWAGIMRRTTGATDFEAANFEFIEFWMLDPFLDTTASNPGGELYLNLGKVSEDVLPDGRRSYENGLPRTAAEEAAELNLSRTPWGRVPDILVPTNAFDNNPESRATQDVGYDGLGNAAERTFFSTYVNNVQSVVTDGAARERITTDPSSDDYSFFGDARFAPGTDILTRYQRYANPEGNSPLAVAGDNFSRAQTLLPDVEDINNDNTLNATESYYEYRVPIRPSELAVGRNGIIDRRVANIKLPNGRDTVAIWYQFRIPLRSGVPLGSIQDFKAIDFIRLYATQFSRRTTMRFANFRIVSTSWRSQPLTLIGDTLERNSNSSFDLATVSIEENASKTPFPYVVPPDIQRQGVPASPIPNQLQNEQSLQLRARDLADNESRLAYKNVTLDLRFYERLKMWVHAEAIGGMSNLVNVGDATVFVRLGSDFDQNYYEYEVPLTLTANGAVAPQDIWPLANQIDLAITDLSEAKTRRNVLQPGQPERRFSFRNGLGHIVSVRGNPQLNNVRTISIGVRNPRAGSISANATDNGQPIAIEVWANELRVTDFDQSAGWAASGRINLKLADLGNVTMSGAYSTPGFGGVERRIFERTLDFRKQYDVATNLQLGKLLPKKAGIELPVFLSYGERTITPKWNPIDPDVLLASQLELTPQARRGAAEAASIDYQRTYSYAFNNVRRVRQDPTKKARLWDIENFSFSYAFSENFRRNAQIEQRLERQYRGGINWSHNFNPKLVEPFKKWFGGKSNLLTAFNFYLWPQSATVNIQGERYYEEEKLRQTQGLFGQAPAFSQPAYYFQDFRLTRSYTLRWDLTKSLSLNYNSTVGSRVDEPRGPLDTEAKRDTLWQRLLDGGRTLNFNQNVTGNYRLPFDKVKALNWINSSLNYTADYRWLTAAIGNDSLGNTVGNTQGVQSQLGLNLGNLYRKFPAIQRLLKPIPRKTIYSLRDSTREEGDYWRVAGKNLYKALANIVFSIQNIDVNYSLNGATTLPGFLPTPSFFGNAYGFEGPGGGRSTAPGWDFILGVQPRLTPDGWIRSAAERGWVSRDARQLQQFQQSSGYTFTGRTSVSFFKGFRVDVSVQQSRNDNSSGVFVYNDTSDIFSIANALGTGNFTTSYFSMHTAFLGSEDLFREFNGVGRQAISTRLRTANPGYLASLGGNPARLENGFWNGYTGTSQDVLIPAFLATYGPNSLDGVALSPFPRMPLPNWNVNYTGLSDIWFLKEIFKQVTLSHGYRSTYSVNYLNNLRAFDFDGDGFIDTRARLDSVGVGGMTDTTRFNFQPLFVIQQVLISESFVPLIGINLAFYNGITALIDYKQTRTLQLNVGALQLIETNNREFTLNLAWTRQRTSAPLRIFGSFIEIKNQLTTRFEVTVRDTRTQNRRIDSNLPFEPTAGNLGYTVKPSIDYTVSQQLTARAYYELSVNKPVLSTAFPTRFSAWGVQIRFTLQ